jgi:hypothetical protein
VNHIISSNAHLASSWTGKGDQHYIPTGLDLRWKAIREAEVKNPLRDTKR